MRKIQTTGDQGLDRELDAIWQAIVPSTQVTTISPVVSGVSDNQVSFTEITVQDVAGATVLSVPGIEFDTADGFAVSTDTTTGFARIDRTAAGTTPTAQSVASTAGTSTVAANADHAHAPVVTTKGDLLTYGSSPARLAVGTDTYVLTADSAQANGIKWAAIPSSGLTFDGAEVTNNVSLTADTTKQYIRVINAPSVNTPYVQLPNPASHAWTPIVVRLYVSQNNAGTIKRYGSEKIDGSASDKSMNTSGPRMATVVSNGTDWYTISSEL